MSYDFLNSYTIPMYRGGIPPPPPPPPAGADVHSLPEHQHTNQYHFDQTITYSATTSRYYAPGKPMPAQPRRPLKRAADDGTAAQGLLLPHKLMKSHSKEQAAFFTEMVNGYPAELRRLVHAFHCELCEMKMNSLRSASDHYQSKTHDRHINSWLVQNYTEKGLSAPEVRRTLKKTIVSNAPTGPDAFHCELCDLKLTSLTHAAQHYNGRKHKLVASNMSKPSGAGFYNKEGKWVRTASKLAPPDNRFGIGELFKPMEAMPTPDTTTPTAEAQDPTTIAVPPSATATSSVSAKSLVCSVCNVSVTSHSQMSMHLEGSRHKKKVRQLAVEGQQQMSTDAESQQSLGAEQQHLQATKSNNETVGVVATAIAAPPNSILASLKERSDASTDLYRTPSGFYYCKACNISMSHELALQQHLQGKKHIKKDAEERARAASSKK